MWAHIHAYDIRFHTGPDAPTLLDVLTMSGEQADERLVASARRKGLSGRRGVPKLICDPERVSLLGPHIFQWSKLRATHLYSDIKGVLEFGCTGPDGERRLLDMLEMLQDQYGVRLDPGSWTPAGVPYVETMVALDIGAAQSIAKRFGRAKDPRLKKPNYPLIPAEACIYQLAPHLNRTPDYFKLEVRPIDRRRWKGSHGGPIRTLPMTSETAWIEVAHAFAGWIESVVVDANSEVSPVPPVWRSMPLPFTGTVPRLLGQWIVNSDDAMPKDLLVQDVIEDLRYKVALRADWSKWSVERREQWFREGFDNA